MSDVQTLVDRLNKLVNNYYEGADEDAKAVISNLTGIYARLSDVVVAQARELDHWARAARDAEDARDEAQRLYECADEENTQLRLRLKELGQEA